MAIERDDRQLQQQQQQQLKLQRGHVRLAKIYEGGKRLWDWENGEWYEKETVVQQEKLLSGASD